MLDWHCSSNLLAAKTDPEQSLYPCICSRREANPDGLATNKNLSPPFDGRPQFLPGTLALVKRPCTSVPLRLQQQQQEAPAGSVLLWRKMLGGCAASWLFKLTALAALSAEVPHGRFCGA